MAGGAGWVIQLAKMDPAAKGGGKGGVSAWSTAAGQATCGGCSARGGGRVGRSSAPGLTLGAALTGGGTGQGRQRLLQCAGGTLKGGTNGVCLLALFGGGMVSCGGVRCPPWGLALGLILGGVILAICPGPGKGCPDELLNGKG